MIDKLESTLRAENFELMRDFIFGAYCADLYAFRKGRNFIFPQRDFFFFHDIDRRNIDAAAAAMIHEEAREYVNGKFRLPKALRFTVPNIASVFYSAENIKPDMIELAEKKTRSVTGGEIHQIFIIDTNSGYFYSQGLHTARGRSGGVTVNMQLKAIDPQNRAYYLMKRISDNRKMNTKRNA